MPYHEHFKEPTQRAVAALQAAAALTEDTGFKHYLQTRIQALQTDQYRESDLAWLDAKPVRVINPEALSRS